LKLLRQHFQQPRNLVNLKVTFFTFWPKLFYTTLQHVYTYTFQKMFCVTIICSTGAGIIISELSLSIPRKRYWNIFQRENESSYLCYL